MGAVVVLDGVVVGEGANARETERDPVAHAEVRALQAAARARGDWRLSGATLYVTLEPCPMCFGALLSAHVARVVFGAANVREGALGGVAICRPRVGSARWRCAAACGRARRPPCSSASSLPGAPEPRPRRAGRPRSDVYDGRDEDPELLDHRPRRPRQVDAGRSHPRTHRERLGARQARPDARHARPGARARASRSRPRPCASTTPPTTARRTSSTSSTRPATSTSTTRSRAPCAPAKACCWSSTPPRASRRRRSRTPTWPPTTASRCCPSSTRSTCRPPTSPARSPSSRRSWASPATTPSPRRPRRGRTCARCSRASSSTCRPPRAIPTPACAR